MLRLSLALAGIGWFVWLGYEDRSLDTIVLASVFGCLPLYLGLWQQWVAGVKREEARVLASALLGSLIGTLVPLLGVLLMLLKTSLHSHAQPDFAIEDLRAMFGLILPWVVVGTLAGVGVGLFPWESKAAHVAPATPVEYNELIRDGEGDEASDG
jgi:hypothetical protein